MYHCNYLRNSKSYTLIAYNDMELRAVFIGNVKKYRKAEKLSQMALAERCGTSTSYIGEIEIGKKFPSVEMVQNIAEALGVAPYRLFMEEQDSCLEGMSPELKQELVARLQKAVAEVVLRGGA